MALRTFRDHDLGCDNEDFFAHLAPMGDRPDLMDIVTRWLHIRREPIGGIIAAHCTPDCAPGFAPATRELDLP